MIPFSAAVDTVFARFGVDAVYTPDGGGAVSVRVIDAAVAVDANSGGSGELFETNIYYSAKEADLLADYLFERVFRNPTYSACP